MDEILVDLHACVNNLGTIEDDKFFKDIDTTVCLRDILRHLRKETKECEIRRELGKLHLIKHYLIPIIKSYYNDAVMFDITIRLTMNLTQPALICFRQEIPTDAALYVKYLEIENNLKVLKLAFANKELLSVLSGSINTIFNKEWTHRSEDDHMLVERILIIIRNVLFINTSEKDLDRFQNDHDKLILTLMNAGWTEVLLYLSNSEEEERFAFHTLEIISLIYREQDPEDLVFNSEAKKIYKSKTDALMNRDFERIRLIEQQKESLSAKTSGLTNSRALRYGGSFQLTDIQTVAGLSLVYHRDITGNKVDLERDRKLKAIPKKSKPNTLDRPIHKSSEEVISKLNNFNQLFLEHGYNNLMSNARNFIVRSQIQPDDETYYVWAIKFFMCVCRINRMPPEYVSSTVSIETFHWMYEQAESYIPENRKEKKINIEDAPKLQLIMAAYKEMIRFLIWLTQHNDKTYQKLAATLKSGVFYQEEYIDIYPRLLTKFDPVSQTRASLRDIVEGAQYLIKILQDHKSFNMNVIRKLKKKRIKAKENKYAKQKSKTKLTDMPNDVVEELMLIWAEIEEEIRDKLRANKTATQQLDENTDLPEIFDPLKPDEETVVLVEGEDPIDSQLARALGLIQIRLRLKKVDEAVGLLRKAQTLWPSEDRICFHSDDGEKNKDDELNMLRSLMLNKRIYKDEDVEVPPDEVAANNFLEDEQDEFNEEDDDEYMDQNAQEYERHIKKEVLFKFDEYLDKFTNPHLIHSLSLLLQDYATNPPVTNNCLVRLMHKIGVKMKRVPLFYSLRNFHTFNLFLNDPLSQLEEFQDMKKFIKYVFKKFSMDAQKNQKLFIEILFERTLKESMDMVSGYEVVEREKGSWNEDLDQELTRLYDEFKLEQELPGIDVVTRIEAVFSDPTKTRRQLIHRLVVLGLISSVKDLKTSKWPNGSRQRAPPETPWTEEEHRQLIVLVDEYRSEKNPIKCIMNALKATKVNAEDVRPRKSVIKKILDLSLIEDEKALGIRKMHASRRRKKNMEIFTENELPSNNDKPDENNNESSGGDEDSENDTDEEEIGEEAAFIKGLFDSIEAKKHGTEEDDLLYSIRKRKPPAFKKRRKIDWIALKLLFCKLSQELQSWFLFMLGENIDSRNNGIVGSLSLIPLEPEEEQALMNPEIEKMMRVCEFDPPNPDGGEDFWRIPEDMDGRELEYFKNCLTRITDSDRDNLLYKDKENHEENNTQKTNKNENSKLVNTNDEIEESNTNFPSEEDQLPDTSQSIKSTRQKRTMIDSDEENDEGIKLRDEQAEITNTALSLQSDPDESSENESQLNNSLRVKRILIDSDDESDHDQDDGAVATNGLGRNSSVFKRRKLILDDDDDEDE